MPTRLHQPPGRDRRAAPASTPTGYAEMYAASVADPAAFWGEQGQRLDWMKPYTKVKNTSFDYHNVSIKWFEDGELNVSANCIDRHLATRGDQTAIIWESDDPAVCRAHHLPRAARRGRRSSPTCCTRLGVKKGDRVVLYLPMIPRGGLRHARLRPHRRDPLDRLRRLLAPTRCARRIEDCGAQAGRSPPTRRRAAAGARR